MAQSTKPSKITVRVLTGLVNNRGAVARDLGVTKVQVNPLIEAGLVKPIGTIRHIDPATGDFLRGRPSTKLALTDKGRKQAKRIVAAQAPAEPVAA